MNLTVEKIVNAVFAGIEMNAETEAMKTELLANAQERFNDLTSSGKTEDEAIASVMESLKGMDEILADYPREAKAAPEDGKNRYHYPASEIRELKCDLRDDDLTIEACEGTEITVLYERDDDQELEVSLSDGRLTIAQPSIFGSGSWWQRLFSFSSHKGEVRVLAPQSASLSLKVNTMSGDVESAGVKLIGDISVQTMSGELEISSPTKVENATLSTASGELTARLDGENLRLKAVSGDVEYAGECDALAIHSVSGEIDATTNAADSKIESVSGNVKVRRVSQADARMNLSSTSGNIRLELPTGTPVRLSASSVSGHVRNDFEQSVGDVVTVRGQSVSGNVELRAF
ncbi:MAG: DUF4097 family beta strand repeat-containing protein [Eubacteriales bacterium]|nr:DUF4097 family beta strand repeat-containing protein [Eubacteriales bacterium]